MIAMLIAERGDSRCRGAGSAAGAYVLARTGAAAPHASPNRGLGALQREVHGRVQRFVLLLDDHARQAAQHDLDAAKFIDAAARTVHVLYSYADALDRARELAELHAELAAKVGASFGMDRSAHCADVRGGIRSCVAVEPQLGWPRDAARE